MSELRSLDNPEQETLSQERRRPEATAPSEGDKTKLVPRENELAPPRSESPEKREAERNLHPKLERNDSAVNSSPEVREQPFGKGEHTKLQDPANEKKPETPLEGLGGHEAQPNKDGKPERTTNKFTDSSDTELPRQQAQLREPTETNRWPDTPRVSDLSEDFFNRIPENRQNAVDMAYRKAPPEIVSALNDHVSDLRPVQDTGESHDEFGRPVKDGCYYSPMDRQVRMDERMGNDEYADVLPHEMSHFLDHARGWESRSPEFSDAMASDLAQMDRTTPEGRMRFNEMLDDAFSTGAAEDRNVSDIMNGMFRNDPEMVKRFDDERFPRYSHRDDYWATPFNREAETYANMGAVQCSGDRISNNFLERYYPNTYNQFKSFYGME